LKRNYLNSNFLYFFFYFSKAIILKYISKAYPK
jgi:hypothetical protein